MNFEQKLKEKLQRQILENVENKLKFILEKSTINNERFCRNVWSEVLNVIEALILEYIEKYTDFNKEKAIKESENFFESVSNENMNTMKKDIKLTEEEERYIIYEETQYYYWKDRISPISEILLRRKLVEFFDRFMGIEKAIEILEEKSERGREEEYIYELLTGKFYKSEEELQDRIKEAADENFNDRINCGGNALELDTCVFNSSNNFEKAVSELLQKVPFIRLLGDKKLEDDEYIVIWKVHEGGGHHFVKVLDDGTIMEKDGSDPIKTFSEWSRTLKGCPEAVLAVKREHEMYCGLEEWRRFIAIEGKEGLDFEETVQLAIQNQSNAFEYHEHSYYFKKDEEGNVYICSEGRIIADAYIEEGECLVDIAEKEKRYVSNTQPPLPLCIKGRKLKSNEGVEK